MIKIYHNPKCFKSRCGLDLLKASGKEYEVVNYLKEGFTAEELKALLAKLHIAPIDLVRNKEAIWQELFAEKQLTDEEIIDAMVQYPKLVERPIVVNGNSAVIGRPTEKIEEIINKQ